jgi:hypothetical protein
MTEQIGIRLTILIFLLTVGPRSGAVPPAGTERLPVYEISRAGTLIAIDGRLDEPAWVAAPVVGAFRFPWFKGGQKEQTVAKILWDDDQLYIAHICQDAHITAHYSKHDDPIPEDDCFEVMMLPDPARPNSYYNIEWNLLGGYVDGHRPEGAAGPRAPWDVQGLRVAGSHVGALNVDASRDEYWLCEVAIPFRNFAGAMPHIPPKPGDEWRLNLNRHGGAVNMQYSQWSPAHTPEPAFHTPETFGRVIFSAKSSPFALYGEEAPPTPKGPSP